MADFDLFVIGAGSGGVALARRAGSHGAKVGICEDDRIGGTCVNRGCIPKKLYVYASRFRGEFEEAKGFGWHVADARFDWRALVAAKERELARLNGVYHQLLQDSGVLYFPVRGALVDAHTVTLGNETVSADTVVIATGSWPARPEIPGIEHAITSNEAFDLPAFPKRIVVVGGGYVACEFAGIFNGLGASTTLIYRGEKILRGFDDDLRALLMEEMRGKGIDLKLNDNAERIEKGERGLIAHTRQGEALEVDQVMMATGRAPRTKGFGLAEIGVRLSANGAVVVDEWSRASVANVYAIGDCTDRVNLTPVAIHEGRCLAETLYNDNPLKPDHRDVPTAVFSQPELGTVGLNEAEARERGATEVFKTRFRPLKHTLSGNPEKVFQKLVVERATGRVVGCHLLGEGAGELIQVLGILVKSGATKEEFDATIAVHPTAAEELVSLREPVREAAE
ncbi:MAG TPA: glutathione-disulfide reductase [Alphaproteobacteria bacterium]|nr:glutathione-disulfide reductase [Alphaproteobacteria bacterium]